MLIPFEELEKCFEINDYIRENGYDLSPTVFYALICVAVDEYSAKNKLDTMEIWNACHEFAKQVHDKEGDVDYL